MQTIFLVNRCRFRLPHKPPNEILWLGSVLQAYSNVIGVDLAIPFASKLSGKCLLFSHWLLGCAGSLFYLYLCNEFINYASVAINFQDVLRNTAYTTTLTVYVRASSYLMDLANIFYLPVIVLSQTGQRN